MTCGKCGSPRVEISKYVRNLDIVFRTRCLACNDRQKQVLGYKWCLLISRLEFAETTTTMAALAPADGDNHDDENPGRPR